MGGARPRPLELFAGKRSRVLMRLLGTGALIMSSFLAGVPSSGWSSNVASASTVPTCEGNNFWGGWVGKNGAGGTSIFQVAFVNHGPSACQLTGYPKVQGYRNGREYPLASSHLKNKLFNLSPTNVASRMSGEMYFTTSASCNALNVGGQTAIEKAIAENSYTVSITFPHSRQKVYIYGLTLDVACGLNITELGWK